MSTEPVRVVVVHWNQPQACERTIRALRASTTPTTIVVVDNGSAPGTADRLHHLADAVIETGENLGFGPGANVGLRDWLDHGSEAWCAVVPHDAVAQPDVLERLVAEGSAHPRAGLLCGDVGDQASPVIDPFLGPLHGPAKVRDGYETVAYPHGTLFVMRRACAMEVGLFDERYFAYNEEADLGLRATAAGWEVGLVRNAMVENPGQGNLSRTVDYLMERNTIMMLRDHFGLRQAITRTLIGVGQLALGVVLPRRRAPWFDARARVLALTHAWRGVSGPPPAELV